MNKAARNTQRDEPPAISRSLSNVRRSPGGWAAACPLCGQTMELYQWNGEWVCLCESYCTHHAITGHVRATMLPAHRWAIRMWLALRLARTPDAWAGLILGLPVQPQAIDQPELQRQRKARLWQ